MSQYQIAVDTIGEETSSQLPMTVGILADIQSVDGKLTYMNGGYPTILGSERVKLLAEAIGMSVPQAEHIVDTFDKDGIKTILLNVSPVIIHNAERTIGLVLELAKKIANDEQSDYPSSLDKHVSFVKMSGLIESYSIYFTKNEDAEMIDMLKQTKDELNSRRTAVYNYYRDLFATISPSGTEAETWSNLAPTT